MPQTPKTKVPRPSNIDSKTQIKNKRVRECSRTDFLLTNARNCFPKSARLGVQGGVNELCFAPLGLCCATLGAQMVPKWAPRPPQRPLEFNY